MTELLTVSCFLTPDKLISRFAAQGCSTEDVNRLGTKKMLKFSGTDVRVVLHTEDPRLQALLCAALGRDYDFELQPSREKLIEMASAGEVDVVVLDCDSVPGIHSQLALLQQFGDAASRVIVMTGDSSRSTAAAFLKKGAFGCVRRPPCLEELRGLIQKVHERVQLEQEAGRAKCVAEAGLACDQLVGTSPKARAVYDLIGRVTDLSASVLITGESGTGKELIARAIHNLGARAGRPFVAVSCGAIPETLIESELFGNEKGAFTGSTARKGYLEAAADGTLFLDEIGELSLHTQVRLLRVLQERQFMPLGSSRPIPLNARIVFATHRDLQQMVSEGTFRKDLYFRVNVIGIKAPALRERTEDIPDLARHFLKRYAEEYGGSVTSITPSAMSTLMDYEWPGNVRELENVIQRSVALADGNTIGRGDLPAELQAIGGVDNVPAAASADSFDELIAQFKVSLANRAIRECDGNKTLAARKLGLSRAYVHRLIRVDRPDSGRMSVAC
jgi:DNA-binding NtrC family response regulator